MGGGGRAGAEGRGKTKRVGKCFGYIFGRLWWREVGVYKVFR